jgi:hypothetical protein
MSYWTLRVFKDAGADVIDEWLTSLPPRIEERFRALLLHMENTQNWVRPFFDKLTGYENVYEIILRSSKQYRLLGAYGPGRREFTLLIGATKAGASKGKPATWSPRNARKIADQRSKLIIQHGSYTDEY